jgi:hypothetical protein
VVEAEITFIVTYRCPCCHAALEARTSEAHTWLRCPECGRASLPPEHMRTLPPVRNSPDDDVLIIGPDAGGPRRAMSGQAESGAHPGGGRRVGLAVGVFVSFAMLAIAFFEGNVANVAIFGVTTIVLLAIVAYMARGR